MKIKNPYIAIVAIFIISLSIYSCRKEFMPEEQISPKAAWAKEYFVQTLLPDEGNVIDPHSYIGDLVQANRMSNKKDNFKIPIWQKAMEGKTPLFDFVEVPLKYTTKVTPMLYVKKDNFTPIVENEILQASFDRLVIYKNKNGKVNQRIVSFVPSKEYLARHKGDISHNRINKLDRDFEGILVYRKWNGEFLYAMIIKDGRAINKVSFNKPKVQLKKTAYMPQECETVILWEWFQVCYYEGDSQVPYYCDPPYKEEVGSYDMCWDIDPCFDPSNAYLIECGGSGIAPDDFGGQGTIDYGNWDPRDSPALRAFEDDYKSHMTTSELAIYNSMSRSLQVSYLMNARTALDMAVTYFPNMNQTDTKADAFRHAYFTLLNVYMLGSTLTTSLGNAHEDGGNNSALARQMDLFNNNAGREAFISYSPDSPIWHRYAILANSLVTSGSLRYISNGVLKPTNQ